ncbi:MAG: hypothetical protein ACWGPS_03115 [Candidatus Promineifilaceae bacterium]
MPDFELLLTLPTPGPAPAGLAWDGHSLWVNDYRQGRLYCLDPDSGQVKDSLLCAGAISGLCWDGQSLWQSRLDEPWLQRINPMEHDIDQTVTVSGFSRLTDLTWDGINLWAVSQRSGQLVTVDCETGHGQSRHSTAVGAACLGFHRQQIWLGYPSEMIYDLTTDNFQWSSSERVFLLVSIDPASGRELTQRPIGFLPMGLTWADDYLWLSDPASGQLICYQLQ